MINIKEKFECCGCTACASICPQNAISMAEDKEGFLYPKVDNEKCVNCGGCEKVCPIINNKVKVKEQKGYLINNKDLEIRKDSTSGGFITPIAEYFIDSGGVVFGAAFDDNLNVHHIKIVKKEDIYKIRKSKYVQSNLKNIFIDVKKELNDNKYVLFSGTPCQVEGLLKFLGDNRKKLITVDVTCRSIPSPKFYNLYKEYIKKSKLHGEEIKEIIFRDKSVYGYKYSVMTVKSQNYKTSMGMESDAYLRGFFENLSVRPSCYSCKFKKIYPESDFRIWDCFFAEKFSKALGDNIGTTRLLINTQRGIEIFNNIKNRYDCVEIPVNKLIADVKEVKMSVEKPRKREEFFKDMNTLKLEDFFQKYFLCNIKIRIKQRIKIILAKTGLYNNIKYIVYKIKG